MSHELQLQIAGVADGALRVRSVRSAEAMNKLFELDVVATASATEALVGEVIGAPATLALGAVRRVSGIVASVREEGHREHSSSMAQYRFKVVPRLFLAKKRKRSRIFQHKRVTDIVHSVLGELGIVAVFRVAREYPVRAYCTQYDESDWAFIKRLAAEEGLFFFQAHPHGSLGPSPEIWIFGDEPAWYPNLGDDTYALVAAQLAARAAATGALGDAALVELLSAGLGAAAAPGAPTLRIRRAADALAAADHEHIASADLERSLAPTRAAFRAFDPERPLAPIRAELEAPFAARLGSANEIYEHHAGYNALDQRFEGGEAERILRRARRDVDVVTCASSHRGLEIGRRFAIDEHHLGHMNRDFVIVGIEQRAETVGFESGETGATYTNTFRAVPADVPYVPKRHKRRVVETCLTATVTAVPGDELLTERMGQVRVQFHWDRDGQSDDKTSCFIRVMQGWAGAGWGTQFIPRAGSEVVVGFDGGDPDRPVILGSLYNAANPEPFPLPRDATRSGIRTQTVPGGHRGNELSFEDARGREEIRVIGERDLDVLVRHDRAARVMNDDRTSVEGARSVDVRGPSTTQLRGGSTLVVGDAASQLFETSRTTEVRGHDALEVTTRSERVKDTWTRHTDGTEVHTIGTEEAPGASYRGVEGTTLEFASKLLELQSTHEIRLSCGHSVLSLRPDCIIVSSPSVIVQGEGAIARFKAHKIELTSEEKTQLVSEEIVLKSSGASVGLASEARIDGAQVLLNSPTQASDTIDTTHATPTRLHVQTSDGEALAFSPYVIHLDDGSELAGSLDRNGEAVVDISGSGTIQFPGLPEMSLDDAR